jgi:hypothetical protein
MSQKTTKWFNFYTLLLNHFVVFEPFRFQTPRFTWGYSRSSTSWIIERDFLNKGTEGYYFLVSIKEEETSKAKIAAIVDT